MSSQLSPSQPSRFRRATARRSPEHLAEEISRLVWRRQTLRARDASPLALERNRRQIARLQWELSHVLIARYLPHAA
ncbi:MAG: hypothetical protein H0V84_11775 [Actinobacteria bacterium]|nr:hypothetical protein [Actinomycetota bacterium]